MANPPHRAPYTCLSTSNHDGRVSDPKVHYFGCLPKSKRERFFKSLGDKSQQRIRREEARIEKLRARLEVHPDSNAGARLRAFKMCMNEYREARGRPTEPSWPHPPAAAFEGLDEGADADVKASVMFFKDSRPYSDPSLQNSFPHQKVTVKELLADNHKENPLMQPCGDDMVRYFHLPANNMAWVEEAIARYYHEKRPDSNDSLMSSKVRRSRTKTEMLLRDEFWQGQQNYEPQSEVHARNMRGMCDVISIDQVATEIMPKNLVLFMPYLHWETDRGRLRSANKIKEVGKEKISLAELLNKAQNRMSRTPSSIELAPILSRPQNQTQQMWEPRPRRQILGDVLRAAAALLEAMEFSTEEQLITEYLHVKSPLHPRRTLDQSYYGALKNTGTRDRDQVVYRATTPEPHEHDPCWEACKQCQEGIRKIPRLIMVDQLWLWILDEKTVISSFPRTWGKSNPDPSAIHKNIRLRLKYAKTDEVTSAYDMALIIIDEASRVFFDRTKTNERQPNMVDMFAEAIRGVTYKQTAAFDQFLIYTDLASREYKRQRNADTATQNHLLNINAEGNLLKEVKDIMDEINIITRIKEQQQIVMESFVNNIRRALLPGTRQGQPSPTSSWDMLVGKGATCDEHQPDTQQLRDRRERARLTLTRADHLLRDIHDRIFELNALLENARHTSAALKDLLTLKQQQAGVIEAREAVKQAAENLKQGQSIMLFTVVTIIFLPLSFCATLFGMNSAEFNGGNLTLAQEFAYMFPISAGIILISITLAFSRSSLTTSIGSVIRNAASLVCNTAMTWIMIKTGLYMLNRSMAVKANQLRDKENKITGSMKAEVMRETNNLEKMRAASTMRDIAKTGSRQNTDMNTPRTPRALSPYIGSPTSPFIAGTRQRGIGQHMEDVELGHRKGASSQVYLVP